MSEILFRGMRGNILKSKYSNNNTALLFISEEHRTFMELSTDTEEELEDNLVYLKECPANSGSLKVLEESGLVKAVLYSPSREKPSLLLLREELAT